MKRDLRRLPDDWWRRKDTSLLLSQNLLQYFVQLYIRLRDQKSNEPNTCTGFLVEINNRLLWVSAAHVIDAINNHIRNRNVIEMRWIDRFEDQRVSTLKASKKRFYSYSGTKEGYDFGAFVLPIYETAHFRNNKKLKPFKIKYSSEDMINNPEGYLFSGFPWIGTKISEIPINEKQNKVTISTHLLTVPIRKLLEKPAHISNENHWDDQESFFGEVLDFVDIESSRRIINYQGMSGAPIISFEREENEIHIMFEGVFVSYSNSGQYIRGEPATRVLLKLDNLLLENIENY
jgi:hypothetical protein